MSAGPSGWTPERIQWALMVGSMFALYVPFWLRNCVSKRGDPNSCPAGDRERVQKLHDHLPRRHHKSGGNDVE